MTGAMPAGVVVVAGVSYMTYGGRELRVLDISGHGVHYRERNADGSEGPVLVSPMAWFQSAVREVL